MDYGKLYKKALERAKQLLETSVAFDRFTIERIFPELIESRDEKIRKAISQCVEDMRGQFEKLYSVHHKDAIAWLEKQKEYESTDFEYVWDRTDCGDLTSALDKYSEEAIINMCHAWYDKGIELERKSWLEKQGEKPQGKTALEAIKEEKVDNTNKVEPKFKEDDWIIRSAEAFKHNTYLIKEVKDYYVCEELKGRRVPFTFDDVHKNFKLWDISDAKDGDVLCGFPYADCPWVGIFHELNDDCTFNSYCYLQAGVNGKFCPPSGINVYGHSSNSIVPATKEQRELLFSKMKDAGYEWDAEYKQLNKIES